MYAEPAFHPRCEQGEPYSSTELSADPGTMSSSPAKVAGTIHRVKWAAVDPPSSFVPEIGEAGGLSSPAGGEDERVTIGSSSCPPHCTPRYIKTLTTPTTLPPSLFQAHDGEFPLLFSCIFLCLVFASSIYSTPCFSLNRIGHFRRVKSCPDTWPPTGLKLGLTADVRETIHLLFQ